MNFQDFTPFQYLLIDLATNYGNGLDKALYDERILWAKENLDSMDDTVLSAEDPNMFTKSLIALKDTLAGKPTGHLVGFDSAASGIQLLSVCGRCVTGMLNTGVINSGSVPDAYKKCTEMMGTLGYLRKVVKLALMTFYYGSKQQPEIAFGEDTADLAKFYEVAELIAPEAFALRNITIEAWVPNTLAHVWTMPDIGVVHKRVWADKEYVIKEPLIGASFTFHTKVNEGKEQGVSLAADITHSIDAYVVREMGRRCNYDPVVFNSVRELLVRNGINTSMIKDRTKVSSLYLVDVLTQETINDYSTNQLAMLLEQIEQVLTGSSFETVFIHDEFKCHPNHMNKLRRHYNRILWELYHSTLIADIIYEATGVEIELEPTNAEVAAKILESNYAIN